MPHLPRLVIPRSEARRRAQRILVPVCDCLETRDLPSTNLFSTVFQSAPPVHPKTTAITFPPGLDGRSNALYQLSLIRHPLYQSVENGHVSKVPLFLPGYTQAKLFDVDVDGAVAQITPSKQLNLTGRVVGPINPADPIVYSFLINRGGASSPGPIGSRPGITYDAIVSISLGGASPQGAVSLLNQQGQVTSTVTLPARDVHIAGTSVSVKLPVRMLPPTGSARSRLSPTGYSFAFEAAAAGGQPSDIAGVVPEYYNAPVGLASQHS